MRALPLFALAALAALTVAGCSTPTTTERLGLPDLQTVPRVELDRYLGTWFEIASFPQSFQQGCTATTATYALRDDGEIDVRNRCIKDGNEDIANGRARVADTSTNAKLEVNFFGPFWGDYWVIDLGDDGDGAYSWAVVGNPSRDYLWILSRDRVLPDDVYAGILERLEGVGYETERLNKTPQP